MPKYGCINVHGSLLPKLRGGAPIHHAIINGDKKTGITIMYMDQKMDAGDIISQKEILINDDDNLDSLYLKMSKLGAELLMETLPLIISGKNSRIKQNENEVTFGYNITKEEEKIDFHQSSKNIHNLIRGLSSTPGAYCFIDNKRMKVYSSQLTDKKSSQEEGTILNTRGTFDVYVSCEGAASVSYQITVEAAQEDLTLYDFVSKLSTSSIFNYTVTVNGQIDYGGDTMASKVSYTYTYGETNYYYQALADDVVIEGQDYGYTNTSKGVMKFYLRDEVVEPACYYSHDSTAYTDVIGTSMFNDLDPDLVPRRKTDDYYLITDSELISDIISNTNVESSGIYSNLETVTARCDGETLTITLDCGIMGTIEEVYANVGTANVPYIDDYLATSGEDILVDEDLETMIGLIEGANYTRDLGTARISTTETVDIGQAIYTPDYMVIDYTDEYIAAALEVAGTEINDNGCYFSEADKGYYTFVIKDGKVDAESISSRKYANGYDAYYEKVGYPNYLSAFDTLDLYEYRYIEEFGGNMYIAYGDDVPDEFFEFLGLSFETTGYIPMGFGLAYTSASTDGLPEIYLISYVNAFMTSTNGCIGITLSNFGLSQSEAVEEFLASLA